MFISLHWCLNYARCSFPYKANFKGIYSVLLQIRILLLICGPKMLAGYIFTFCNYGQRCQRSGTWCKVLSQKYSKMFKIMLNIILNNSISPAEFASAQLLLLPGGIQDMASALPSLSDIWLIIITNSQYGQYKDYLDG